MRIFVPYIGPSTNAIYAGVHYRSRMAHKKAGQLAVMVALAGKQTEPLPPVRITATPVLGKGVRAYDVSNYSYTLKIVEDALVKAGVLAGDNGRHVIGISIESPVRGDKTGMIIDLE